MSPLRIRGSALRCVDMTCITHNIPAIEHHQPSPIPEIISMTASDGASESAHRRNASLPIITKPEHQSKHTIREVNFAESRQDGVEVTHDTTSSDYAIDGPWTKRLALSLG
jgi:hypothetical protein